MFIFLLHKTCYIVCKKVDGKTAGINMLFCATVGI